MFKHGDIFVLTNVVNNSVWNNKRIKYNAYDCTRHTLLDKIHGMGMLYSVGEEVSFPIKSLIQYEAKLVERKSHLPKWW
jgi:hypothetical protein